MMQVDGELSHSPDMYSKGAFVLALVPMRVAIIVSREILSEKRSCMEVG